MRLAFGDCELDLDRMELHRGEQLVALEPQVFAVLAYLVQQRERVVSKEELLDEVWGDRFVSESAITSRIKSARQAVGDDGSAQRIIKTIHGTGYRFVAHVQEVGAPPEVQDRRPSGGPLTLFFTDLERSSSAWNESPDDMASVLTQHDALLRQCVERAGGRVFKHTGDGICAVFTSPVAAVVAAVEAQSAFAQHDWPTDVVPRVRIGLHLGEVIERDGDYFGPIVNKTSRITDAAHGGQIVASASVIESTRELLPDEIEVVDEGWFHLDDFGETNLFQIRSGDAGVARSLRARRHPGVVVHEPRKPLIGRDGEAAHLLRLLDEQRLVTLLGAAGVGKTHLALHVASRADVAGEVPLVELANVRDATAVAPAMLMAIGAIEQPGTDAVESLCRALEERRTLVVVDNCEHVHEAVASICSTLLDRCPDVTLLATSRQRLAIAGERVVTLDPLEDHAAVEVFVDRARALGVELDPRDPAVARVCERLDRIPLALELASAHMRVLGLHDLERLLDDRLELLESPPGAAVDHHRTLELAIAWSYEALEPGTQRALDCLSVFAGPFDLAAAEAVVGEPAESRASVVRRVLDLCERSLVVPPGPETGQGRYRLLESIRLFGDAQLTDRNAVRRRHIEHFVALTERASARGSVVTVDEQVRALERDWDNVRAAFEYAEGLCNTSSMLRVINAVASHAELTATFEVADWCERALSSDLTDVPDDLVRDGLANFSRLLAHRNDLDRAAELADRAEAIGESPTVSMARFWRGWTGGDFASAAAALDTLRAQTDGSGTLYEAARILLQYFVQAVGGIDAGNCLHRLEQLSAGSDIVEAMLQLSHALDGWNWRDPAETLEYLERAQELAERTNLHVIIGGATTLRSMTLAFGDDLLRTSEAVRDGLRHYLDSGMWTTTMAVLPVAARMLNRAGNAEVAAMLLGVRVASRYQGGVSGNLIAEERARAREVLGEQFDDVYARGASLSASAAARMAIDALDEVLAGAVGDGVSTDEG